MLTIHSMSIVLAKILYSTDLCPDVYVPKRFYRVTPAPAFPMLHYNRFNQFLPVMFLQKSLQIRITGWIAFDKMLL